MRRAAAVAALLVTCGAARAETIYLRAGRLLDGISDGVQRDVVVVIDDARITRVAPAAAVAIPKGARTIDLSSFTVLPGLIDCHTHLAMRSDHFEEINNFRDTPFHSAFAAVLNARRTLEAGFTTVRDLGSAPFLAVDLRGAIDEGYLVGPRVVASGPPIGMTGGHADLNGYSPQVDLYMYREERDFSIADGADQVRHAVRGQLKHGVDVIKVIASGGVMTRGDQSGAPQYTVEELRAAVEEAHAAGRKVAAHAHGTEAIRRAVTAGVDSIEHGSLLDDQTIKMMKAARTYLVADIYNDDYLLTLAPKFGLPEEMVKKERAIGQKQRDSFARAVRAGVRVAFGTDAGVYPHGDNARQFALMVKFGLTPAQAIRSATSDAADLLGRAADVGTVRAGRYADLIAVAGDPLADVRQLEHVKFVMKGGKVVKDEQAPR